MRLNPFLTHTFCPGQGTVKPVWIAAESGTTTASSGCSLCKYFGELDQAQIQEIEFQNGIMASQKHWPATDRSTDLSPAPRTIPAGNKRQPQATRCP